MTTTNTIVLGLWNSNSEIGWVLHFEGSRYISEHKIWTFNRTVYFRVDLVKKHVSCHQLLINMVAGKIYFSIVRVTKRDAPKRGSCEVRISIQDLWKKVPLRYSRIFLKALEYFCGLLKMWTLNSLAIDACENTRLPFHPPSFHSSGSCTSLRRSTWKWLNL